MTTSSPPSTGWRLALLALFALTAGAWFWADTSASTPGPLLPPTAEAVEVADEGPRRAGEEQADRTETAVTAVGRRIPTVNAVAAPPPLLHSPRPGPVSRVAGPRPPPRLWG